MQGNPVFPTDSAGNEVLATNAQGVAVPARDFFSGNPVYPSTTTAASTLLTTANTADDPALAGNSLADKGSASSSGVTIVIAVAAVLVIAIIVRQ